MPAFLPGKSHRQRRLVGYSPWGCKRAGHDFVTKQQQRHPLPCSQASANVLMTVVNITWILAVCGETTVCLYALPYPHVLDEMTEQLSHSAQVQSWDLNWALSTLSPLTYTSVLSPNLHICALSLHGIVCSQQHWRISQRVHLFLCFSYKRRYCQADTWISLIKEGWFCWSILTLEGPVITLEKWKPLWVTLEKLSFPPKQSEIEQSAEFSTQCIATCSLKKKSLNECIVMNCLKMHSHLWY